MRKIFIIIITSLTVTSSVFAQSENDSSQIFIQQQFATNDYTFKSFLIPGLMTTYGFIALKSKYFKMINEYTNINIPHSAANASHLADDILQFSPALMVYGLNIAGIKGKNNVFDQTMIYVMSNLILNGTVQSIKNISQEQRPDLSDYRSFPSGHTAEAFASAEFLREEYKDKSPWLGYLGYGMAVTTGCLRMYHQKHWVSDVIAGAGLGIISTRLSYILYPLIQKKFFKIKMQKTLVMPSLKNQAIGFQLVHRF
ncbi:MAG: phosphatase PAP2 family protein [Chitinophagaceae bacterium]|nr:phosphatase PAP2 family protein [Chitinophagaceae bacterium]